MWKSGGNYLKLSIVAAITALTLAIHYGFVIEPIFGHVHWFHLLHGRFCYIPIMVSASWFGLRGGLYSATAISLLILPYVFGGTNPTMDIAAELTEIAFYYFIAILTGALVDREFLARRRQLQAELVAERSQRLSMIGQIAAGVAHEIKNPLASIKGAADILTDKETSEQDKTEFSTILHGEVRRIDATVGEFLNYAKPKETVLKKIDLAALVNSCIKQISIQANDSRISLKVEVPDELYVTGDDEKLRQMMLNLLLNALQASPVNSDLVVDLGLSNSSARLRIKDSGSGIAQDDIQRIFEPFFTTKSSGTGLGLAIVKSIVDSHNGRIDLTSTTDGTIVTVTIPLAKDRVRV